MKLFKSFSWILCIFFCFLFNVNAAIPRTIAYQGLLTDPSGNPVADGKQNIVFSLYDAATAVTALWSEELTEVQTSKGMFSVLLGGKSPLSIPFDKQYWIEIKVNSKVVSPRVQLSASAYAMRADSADVAKSVVGLSGMLGGKAEVGHRHSVLFKNGKNDTALVADSSGKIGIGTRSPLMKLHLQGGALGVSDVQYPNINLRMDCATSGMGKLRFSRWDGTTNLNNAWLGHFFNETTKQYMFGFASAKVTGTANTGDSDTASVKVAINQNGYFGIGTTNPLQKFVVSDDETDGFEIYLRQPAGTVGLQAYNRASNFYSKMQLDASQFSFMNGNVGIETVTPNPNYKLDVNGLIQCKGVNIIDPTGSLGFVCINDGFGGNETERLYNFRVNYDRVNNAGGKKTALVVTSGWNGGKVGIGDTVPTEILTVAGNIKAAGFVCGTSNLCSSDRRFKLNLSPIKSALEKLTQLQGLYYDWDKQNFPERNFPETRQIGLIAQDVEKVLPELVNTDSHGYKSLSYDKLTAVLIEAVKELKSENETLRKEIQSIKEQLNGNDGAVQ